MHMLVGSIMMTHFKDKPDTGIVLDAAVHEMSSLQQYCCKVSQNEKCLNVPRFLALVANSLSVQHNLAIRVSILFMIMYISWTRYIYTL